MIKPQSELTVALLLFALLPETVCAECCSDAPGCQRMVAYARSATCQSKEAQTCQLLTQIVDERPTLRSPDFGGLQAAQKDLAGTYQFVPAALRVVNEWNRGDAPGIERAGRAELSVTRLCMNAEELRITARTLWFSMEMRIDSRSLAYQHGDRALRAHAVELDGKAYKFVWY